MPKCSLLCWPSSFLEPNGRTEILGSNAPMKRVGKGTRRLVSWFGFREKCQGQDCWSGDVEEKTMEEEERESGWKEVCVCTGMDGYGYGLWGLSGDWRLDGMGHG